MITTRLELKEYCLRKLGAPVIDINVADQQLEDRLDEAVQYFNEWHYDGCEKIYMKQLLNASKIYFSAPIPASSYHEGEQVIGSISGATASIYKQLNVDYAEIWKISGTFLPDENLIGQQSQVSYSLKHENFLILGELDKKYIDIPYTVMSVTKIFQITAILAANYLFDPIYYSVHDMIWNFGGLDLISYELLKERLNQISNTFSGQKPLRFNRHLERLYIDMDWARQVAPGYWLVIECYRILNPEEHITIWDNYFLKEYVTALFKIQWGENLSKFASIQLPGGVTLDGPRILSEGVSRKTDLETQMQNGRWSEPLAFTVG